MIEVRLPIEQWQQVLAILSQAPWAQANPLIMGIGEQLRARVAESAAPTKRGNGADEGVATERG
jgi:hypothetical protein